MDWSWIGGIIEGAFGAASSITNTVVGGQNRRTEMEVLNEKYIAEQEQKMKTYRTLIFVAGAAVCIILFGMFVYSNRKK